MTNKKLNRLLSILDEYEISLNLTAEELKLLPNQLVDVLETTYKKSDIIAIILVTFKNLTSKAEYEKQMLSCPPILGELEPLIGYNEPDLTPCKPLRFRSETDMPKIIDFDSSYKLGPSEEVHKRILIQNNIFKNKGK